MIQNVNRPKDGAEEEGMFFKVMSIFVFCFTSFILAATLGGWGLIGENFFLPGLLIAALGYGFSLLLFWMSRTGEPHTALGQYAKTMTIAYTIRNVGYFLVLAVVLFAVTPQGQQFVSWWLHH